jgi:hypothetical protein
MTEKSRKIIEDSKILDEIKKLPLNTSDQIQNVIDRLKKVSSPEGMNFQGFIDGLEVRKLRTINDEHKILQFKLP